MEGDLPRFCFRTESSQVRGRALAFIFVAGKPERSGMALESLFLDITPYFSRSCQGGGYIALWLVAVSRGMVIGHWLTGITRMVQSRLELPWLLFPTMYVMVGFSNQLDITWNNLEKSLSEGLSTSSVAVGEAVGEAVGMAVGGIVSIVH